MNEVLAALFAARVAAALPFLDRVTGLARLYTKPVLDGDTPTTVKLPIPVTFTAADCEKDDQYLVPDAKTVGILFFEDGGVQPLVNAQHPANLSFRQASLRLLLWINPRLVRNPLNEVQLVLLLERALKVGNPRWTSGDFLDINTTYNLLPAETSLYGRYSFASETPLLLPPYRLLGLDLRVQFRLGRCTLPPTVVVAPTKPRLPYPLPFKLTS